MFSPERYRVVGVRTDGTKRLLSGGLKTRHHAQSIANLLNEPYPFVSVLVEIEDWSSEEASEDDCQP